METLKPKNVTAMLEYRGRGNPPSSHPSSSISNCFPGLELDFRNFWKHIFVGIELHESDFRLVAVSPELAALGLARGMLLFQVISSQGGTEPAREHRFFTQVVGPAAAGGEAQPLGPNNLEWANALADLVAGFSGRAVTGQFIDVANPNQVIEAELVVRPLLDVASLLEVVGEPGALTQSLCSPWQADYRECGCYYWAASRPDFVNVDESAANAAGYNWLARDKSQQPGEYRRDNPDDPTQLGYEDLYREWQKLLRFVQAGREQE